MEYEDQMVLLHPVIPAHHCSHLLDQSAVYETRLSIEVLFKPYKNRQRRHQDCQPNLQERDFDFVRHIDCLLVRVLSERCLGLQ